MELRLMIVFDLNVKMQGDEKRLFFVISLIP